MCRFACGIAACGIASRGVEVQRVGEVRREREKEMDAVNICDRSDFETMCVWRDRQAGSLTYK